MISRKKFWDNADRVFAKFGDVVLDGVFRKLDTQKYQDGDNCRVFRSYDVKVIADKFINAKNPDSLANIMTFEALITRNNLDLQPEIGDELIVVDILFVVTSVKSDPAFSLWVLEVTR